MAAPVLEVADLRTEFRTPDGVLAAVDGLSFSVGRGEMLGIVGESGCGKSVAALSVLRLVAAPAGRIARGSVKLGGQDLLAMSEREMRAVRGRRVSMIFQEPMSSLNPVLTIGRQIAEVVMLHEGLGAAAARARALDMLRLVRIPEPERRLADYPHQLSGGMRQRVMIAIALTCNPEVLIADEPTTALDVTIQAQILELIAELRARTGTAVVLITHDLGIVAEQCQRVIVMYAGRKVEEAPVEALFARPRHPYTAGLMRSMPRLALAGGIRAVGGRRPRLTEIPGTVPALLDRPPGCAFAPRCPLAGDRCRVSDPPIEEPSPGHLTACFEHERVEVLRG